MRSTRTIIVTFITGILACGSPATGQTIPRLSEVSRLELSSVFFMDQALDLLTRQPTRASARAQIESVSNPIQFMGTQTIGNEVTDGYVSRFPETFVSVTLFFERDTEALDTVHVVMSPGMWSRALGLIERAVDGGAPAVPELGDHTYLLGVEDAGGREVRVVLSEQDSDLGTIYAINYMTDNR